MALRGETEKKLSAALPRTAVLFYIMGRTFDGSRVLNISSY